MRKKGTPASLAELIGDTEDAGEAKNEFGLKDLNKILGEKLPDLPHNRIGRYRLLNALRLRFGPGYRNIPGIKNVVHEFDELIDTANIIKANKET